MDHLLVAAQSFGAAGDALSFSGAVLLAMDLVKRDDLHAEKKALLDVAAKAESRSITLLYYGIRVTNKDEAEDADDLIAVALGKRGLVLLCLGLLFLGVYRCLEFVAAWNAP